MKTLKHLFLLWLGLFFYWSCSSGDDDKPTPSQPEEKPQINIDATQSSLVLEQQGGTVTVSFTATAAWTADVSAATRATSWCSVSPTSGSAGNVTLTVTTTTNNTYDERRATVILRSGVTSKSFTVSQKQKNALTVTSNKLEIAAGGGEATIEVKANVNYQYEIAEAARSWISVADSRGLSASTLKLNIVENESLEKREGTVTIHSGELSETVTIYQAGSVPTIILTKNEYDVGSGGETIQVELRSNVDYEVQLPSDGWITENMTRAFSSHTHYFTVAANDTYDLRTAEITFINKENNVAETVKVTQVQRDAIVVAQSEYTVPAEGGSLDFTVNTNVDFTVESSVAWITQTETRGLTEIPLHFTVAENTTDEAREGIITLSSGELKQAIRVIQKAKSVLFLSKNEFIVGSASEQIQVEVTSNGEYTVQLSNVSWITEVKTRSATTTTHTFSIAENDTYDARSAEITFTDKATGAVEKVKVTQAQLDVLTVAKTEYTVAAAGENIDVEVSSNVEYTVESSVSWIKQVSTRGLTGETLCFMVEENTSDEIREGLIILYSGSLKQAVKVIQKAKSVFFLSKSEFIIGSGCEYIQVEVTSNGEYTVQLPNVSWITEVKTRGATTTVYTFFIAENDTYDTRSTEIIFMDKATGSVEKVKVTQAQLDVLTVTKTEYAVTAAGENIDVEVNSNVEFIAESSVSWIKQISTRGLTGKTLCFMVEENTSDEVREGIITLRCDSLEQIVKVKQNGAFGTGGGIDSMPTQKWE